MTLEREEIEKLDSPVLPNGYSFSSYTSEMREEVADLIFKSNEDNIDIHVFPEFFGTIENTVKLLEDIEKSVYGKYKNPQSKIIMKDNECVGICFMSLTADDTGYIPEIAIQPSHRRLGLGRAILVHSLKEQARVEEGLVKIDLDVTLANHALNLYQSVGFKETQTYSMYSS